MRVFSAAGREIWFERSGVRLIQGSVNRYLLIKVSQELEKPRKSGRFAKSSNNRGVRLKRNSDKRGSTVLV